MKKNLFEGIDAPRLINIAELKRDNIVLERFLRIGDYVVMHMDEETRHYVKAVPDGTIGIVTGFRRYDDYYGRINNFGEVPGKYIGNGVASVVWFDGSNSEPGAGNLRFLFDHEEKQKQRRDDKNWNEAFEMKVRVGDLPDIEIYEGDIVTITSERIRRGWDSDELIVRAIDWRNYDRKRTDGSPMPLFDCTALEPGRGSQSLDVTEVKLKERGNVWKWYNDKRDEITFKSLEEELAFHFSLGNDEQIWCAQSDNYHWPFQAILPALQAGTIDVIKHQGGLFGGSGSMAGYKLTDSDLSERTRAHSLKGFSEPMRTRVVGKEWNDYALKEIIRRAVEFGLPFYNVNYGNGFVDASEMLKLNIQVVEFEQAHLADLENVGGYIYFFPQGSPFDLPHTSSIEINEDKDELVRAMGRKPRGDRMRIRVQSDKGWSDKNRDLVIAACKNFGVVFADRANVADDVMKESGIDQVVVNDPKEMSFDFELNGYVFFTHRGMKDLPFDITVKGE